MYRVKLYRRVAYLNVRSSASGGSQNNSNNQIGFYFFIIIIVYVRGEKMHTRACTYNNASLGIIWTVNNL